MSGKQDRLFSVGPRLHGSEGEGTSRRWEKCVGVSGKTREPSVVRDASVHKKSVIWTLRHRGHGR
jgi:hypothetical protein